MGDVYKNSLFNIAATAAADGRVGCFFDRDPILVQKLRIQIDSPHCQPASKTGLYDLVHGDFWNLNIENTPLNSRAWVLQEQLLSPKILHCGKNQLLWECQEMVRLHEINLHLTSSMHTFLLQLEIHLLN